MDWLIRISILLCICFVHLLCVSALCVFMVDGHLERMMCDLLKVDFPMKSWTLLSVLSLLFIYCCLYTAVFFFDEVLEYFTPSPVLFLVFCCFPRLSLFHSIVSL